MKKKETIYLVWRDMDYEGWYSQEFKSLKEARKSIQNRPKGDSEFAILTKVIH